MVLLALFGTFLSASTLGIVQKVDGIVKVKHKDSIKKSKVKNGYEIQEGDIISTFRSSDAVLSLKDDSKVILKSKSTIAFIDADNIHQSGGKVFYKITSRDAKHKLKIKTNFAIIGIKGTTFIVGSDANDSYVALKEGLIGVESIKEQFRLYKKKVLDEYEAYVRKQQQGFKEFKEKGEEYVMEVTPSFDLHAGNVVSFEGDKAVENPLEKEDDFSSFEELLSEQPEGMEKENTQMPHAGMNGFNIDEFLIVGN